MRELKPLPSAEYLNSILKYNPDTGDFLWKENRSNIKAGTIAGADTGNGYRHIGVDGVQYKSHRLAFKMFYDLEPPEIDHRNRCRSDNWIDNLRASDDTKNQWNKSGTKGCYLHKGRWVARIKIEGKQHYLGAFDTEEEAMDCYQAVKKLVHPQ